MNRVWFGSRYVELTAADDGLTHRVAQHAYDEGVATGAGPYKTLCGRTVLATTMITTPGPACQGCRETLRQAI